MIKTIEWQNWSTKLFAGLYESYLYNSDTIYNVNNDRDDDEPELDIDNWDDFARDIGAMCAEKLAEYIGENYPVKSLTFLGISSPKYYNFETDRINCKVEYDQDELLNFCFKDHRDDFAEYLQENFTSGPGFISFVPNNLAEFWQDRDDNKCIECMIEFVVLTAFDYDTYWQETADCAYDILWEHLTPVKQDNE